MDPTALSLRPSHASISLVFIPISPQHIILLFSSVENCLPFLIAIKSCFFFKKTCTGSVCSLRTSGRLNTISEQLIFHHEKAMHNYCTNLSWEPLKLFCDPWYICFKYLTFRRQRHKLSAPTVLYPFMSSKSNPVPFIRNSKISLLKIRIPWMTPASRRSLQCSWENVSSLKHEASCGSS